MFIRLSFFLPWGACQGVVGSTFSHPGVCGVYLMRQLKTRHLRNLHLVEATPSVILSPFFISLHDYFFHGVHFFPGFRRHVTFFNLATIASKNISPSLQFPSRGTFNFRQCYSVNPRPQQWIETHVSRPRGTEVIAGLILRLR